MYTRKLNTFSQPLLQFIASYSIAFLERYGGHGDQHKAPKMAEEREIRSSLLIINLKDGRF